MIEIQGWRGIGNASVAPELVVQRRAAFILDRSGTYRSADPTNGTIINYNFPTSIPAKIQTN